MRRITSAPIWATLSAALNTVLALGIALGALNACSDPSPILVGYAGELTGSQSDLGVHGRDGVQLAVERINTDGGIRGRTVELLVRDDQGTREGAQAADRELIDAGVVAIIGHMTSGQTLAGLEVTGPAGVLLLSPTSSTPQLSHIDDLFFRVSSTSLSPATALARHVADTRGLRRLALLYDTSNAAFTEAFASAFAQAFESDGGQTVGRISFSSAETHDWAALADALLADAPDGILLIASALDTAILAQQIRQRDPAVPLFSSGWAQTETLIQNGGHAVDGLEIVVAYDADSPAADYQEFKSSYERHYGRAPTFAAGQAYEAMQVLATALNRTNGHAQGLRDALLDIENFEVLTGSLSLDPYGDMLRPLILITILDGEFVSTATLAPLAP